MTTRGQINSNFYQIVTVDSDGNPIQVTTEYIEPAGANRGVQFNDGNALGSDADFSYNKTTGTLSVPNITSANITGNVTNATHANVADVANSVSGANVVGSVQQANVANTANSVSAANIVGTVANANYASYSSNSNSVNAAISNVSITGGSANYLLSTNGSGTLSWVAPPTTSSISNGTSNVSIPATNGNVTVGVGGVSNVVVITSTGINTIGDVYANAFYGNVYGNVVGNIVVPGVNTSVIFNTDGNADGASNFLFNKVSNTLFVPIANVTDVNATGNVVINGNITVSGNTNYTNVNNLYVTDPLIELGGGPNGAPLTTNDGLDRGEILHYYTTQPVDAFIGWDNSNAEFALASNVSVANNVVTINQLGNVRSGYFIGNGSQLTSITGANVTGTVANATHATVSNSSNSVAGANVTGQVANSLVAGTVYTNAQPNITSLGTLSNVSVTANVDAGNIRTDHLLYSNGAAWSFGGNPGGSNTTIQFNDNGVFGGISTVTWDGTKLNLGNISNVLITGGSSNYFARTDGAGNLSWLPLSSNLTVATRTTAVNISINNYQMNVEARSGNVVVNVN